MFQVCWLQFILFIEVELNNNYRIVKNGGGGGGWEGKVSVKGDV